MRLWIRLVAVIFVIAGASTAFAAPLSPTTTPFAPRISIALPAAQFDFSDLDMRDEFNRPISVQVVRVRFEQLLNRELNRLLVENLTPLQHAWMDMLDHAIDAFGAGLRRVIDTAVQIAVIAVRGLSLSHGTASSRAVGRVPTARTWWADAGALISLTLRSISSTRLLR